jgi:hypothetical protein
MSRAKTLIKLLERLIKQDHLYSGEQLKEMKSQLKVAKENIIAKLQLLLERQRDTTTVRTNLSIRCGGLQQQVLTVYQKLQMFLSSTFDDTKCEQDFMLEHLFPFLRDEICSSLSLEFDVVSMRWGVRGKALDTHQPSEMCMQQLEDCKRSSVSAAYLTFQSHPHSFG